MMIFNIDKTPDPNILGPYKTFKQQLIIGSSLQSDLPIQDDQINDIHCIFETKDEKINIKSSEKTGHYFLNGKKFIGFNNLNIGDKVQVGNTFLTLTNYSSPKEFQHLSYQEIYSKTLTNFPEIVDILDALEKEIMRHHQD